MHWHWPSVVAGRVTARVRMKPKQSSSTLSTLAARVLKGYEPSRAEILRLAASVLSQDQTKGQE